jgi:hypothetical protein
LSNVCDKVVKQISWGKEMLVSSFGYLNKNTNTINGIRTESNKQQKPIVNQGLVFDVPAEGKQPAEKTQKAESLLAKCLNIIA